MTTTTTTNLAELAFGTQERCAHELGKKLQGSGKQAKKAYGLVLDDDEVVAAVAGSLNGPIGDVFHGVWERYDKVRAACAATSQDPKQERWVPFARIPLTTTKRSDLVVDGVGGVGVPKIVMKFALSLEMTLDAAQVHVRGGHVVGFSTGTATASGWFGCNQPGSTKTHVLAKWTPRPVTLPGYIHLTRVAST